MPSLLSRSLEKLSIKKSHHDEQDPLKQGDLQIGKQLGAGGTATVYKAHRVGEGIEHSEIGLRLIPLKDVLNGQLNIRTRDDLKRHLEWVQKLHEKGTSPYILDVYGYRILKNDLLSFTQLCEGGDLFDRITQSPDGHFTEDEAREAMRSLAKALSWVHRLGTIHRDIKGENILYARKDSPVSEILLMDFWSCILNTTPDAYHEGLAGTPGYCAPEVLAGKPYRMNIDSWSYGIVVYESLTGRSPLVGSTPEEINRETLQKDSLPYPSQYWGKISKEAKDFTQKLLTKDPDKRMTVDEALEHPWLAESHTSSAASDSSESSHSAQADTEALANRKKTIHETCRADEAIKGQAMSKRMTMAIQEMEEADSAD